MPSYRDYPPMPPSYGGRGMSLRDLSSGGDNIVNLIMARGQAEANNARQQGDILANTITNVGQQVGQGIQDYQAKKKEDKEKAELNAQDTAFMQRISNKSLPPVTPAETIKIYGMERGPAIFKGFASLHSESPDLKTILAGHKAASPEMQALAWPKEHELLVQAGVPVEQLPAPDKYDPGWFGRFETAVSGAKPGESFTLGPGQARFGPDGQPIANVPAAPKEPTPFNLGPGDVRYDGQGNVVASRPAVPKEKEPKLVQVETVGPDGRPVTQFVTPTAGASYPKPTGAGKASTGQQKKALNFFNRGKEAQEIASAMEEGGQVNALKVKYIPEWANILRSNPEQAYVQSQRAFTEARLRKESGAAIAKSEYDKDALTYFKQPGDSKEVIAQKRAGRNAILAGIAFESGDALKEFYGDDAETMLSDYKRNSKAGGAPSGAVSKKNPFRD